MQFVDIGRCNGCYGSFCLCVCYRHSNHGKPERPLLNHAHIERKPAWDMCMRHVVVNDENCVGVTVRGLV